MKVVTYEATVENGQVKLSEEVRLPENARVYVVVTGVADASSPVVGSPRLAHPEQARDFVKEVLEHGSNAGLR